MTAGWCSRTVRAAVFAAVCVLLAALGHVLMSGSQVPARVLAAGFAATGVAGWSLAGRERGLPLIVSLVLAAQTALHFSFSLAQSATEAAPPRNSMGLDHMGADPMNHMQGMGDETGGGASSFGMLAAHLLAALLCGLWLAHGERAAFRIMRTVAGRLATPLRLLLALPVTPDRPRPSGRRPRSDRAPRLLLLVHAITSRGPPAGTAVV
ncbi:hypothetical protein [Streptomyces cellulosae]|uniref:hypothetical protein n=1 Tax=Streptomyces cellulosae TaxID=1968 RepID=UPI0004C80701|nr:hypothetical protein [Streptomyces cellulosae]